VDIEGHYPTQAKGRLEWGTQQLLPVWLWTGEVNPSVHGPETVFSNAFTVRREDACLRDSLWT
jgi:hypothetical protein